MIDILWTLFKNKRRAAWRYVGSTGSMLIGTAAQSLAVIILARFLGAKQYGFLASITAMASLGVPFCGLGAAETMRRRVGRDPKEYPVILGHCLILLGLTGIVVVAIITIWASLVIHFLDDDFSNTICILLLVTCNTMLYAWIVFVEQVFLAHLEFTYANIVNASFGVSRALTVLVACGIFGVNSLESWAIWNACVYVAASFVGVLAISLYGRPKWQLIREELVPGLTLSASGILWALRQNVDILALSSVVTPEVLGAYGVVRRIMGVASVLGTSFDRLIYPKLVIAGAEGPARTLALATKYAPYALLVAVPTSLAMFVLAPLLPWIVGEGFKQATMILRVLSLTFLLGVMQNLAFDALNASDRHRTRFIAGTTAGVLGIGLMLGLTYAYGIVGTFVGAYVSDSIMMIVLWSTLIFLSRR